MQTLKNKIALITGASSGIGYEVTKSLLSKGVHVIALGRNKKKLKNLSEYAEIKNYNITTVQLDLKEPNKLSELSKIISKRFKKIDILIANAAILGEITPLDHYNPKIWQEVLFTNLTANWLLIKNFNYLIQKSPSPHIIFTSCSMSKKNKAYWGAYLVSKSGLAQLAQIYSEENKTTPAIINMIDPGICNTKLRNKAFPNEPIDTLKSPKEASAIFLYCLLQNNIENGDFLYYDKSNEIQISKKFQWL